MKEWLCYQGSADDFRPKIFGLVEAIEQDLTNQWSNTEVGPRTKIGVIGYTSAGKSTLLNRLLGVKSLNEQFATSVRSTKSTYFPLEFNRKDPFLYQSNPEIKIPATLVDIQGLDKDKPTISNQIEAGNYLDEIRKSNCDIYILVFDDQLRPEQEGWIDFIEQIMKRKCLLVRSKIDICYLKKFREKVGKHFGRSSVEQHTQHHEYIMQQIRNDNPVKSRHIFLTATDYEPASTDAEMLLETNSFDFNELLNELSKLAFKPSHSRIHSIISLAVTRVINTCFRRGYVLNVLKYKIAAGFAAIIPFGDQLPRYLSRNSIEDAYGIDKLFLQYITDCNLTIDDGSHLKTSVFKDCVKTETKIDSDVSVRTIGTIAGQTAAVAGSFGADVIRVATPATVTVSRFASIAFSVATLGIGLVLSGAVCAWSAVSSGNHIFSYVNSLCDDLILILNALIISIIERETMAMDKK
ncbi:hypothetical protein I4U23_012143 [Adineta vaga]|nr:hypothetical protein I4U23_012143 [Adineta vaga]